MLRTLNLAVAFLLELAMLAALGVAGSSLGGPAGWAAGLGAPAVAIGLWGALLAPKSPRRLPMPWLMVAKLALFGSAGAALAGAGWPGWGAALVVAALVNLGLAWAWDQEGVA